jgi:hypothetical protein
MNFVFQPVRLVVIVMLLVGIADGQIVSPPPSQAEANVNCLERLQFPPYPLLATQARIQGTITAAIFLTTGGKVAKVETDATSTYSNANHLLGEPVLKVVREAKFRSDCAGKTVRLIFHFDLEGASRVRKSATFSFGYPNNFWIVAEAPLFQP